MSESKKNRKSEFNSQEEALEFLVQKSQEEALKESWKKELELLPDEEEYSTPARGRSRILKIVAVAASLFFVVSFYFLFTEDHSDTYRLAEAMIHETNFIMAGDMETRGAEMESGEGREALIKKQIRDAMDEKNYAAAVKMYASIEKTGLTNEEKFTYALAIARSEHGDLGKAKKLLKVHGIKKLVSPQAMWLEALIYLKSGERKKSKKILNKLIQKSNYQSKNAKVLLQKMSD